MTLPDFIDRFVEFAMFVANVLVGALATKAYQDTRKRCLLLIAVSAGIGAVLTAAPWIREDRSSWTYWGFYTVATICDLSLWVAGAWLLFRDYATLIAHRSAAPNGGPATPVANSGVTEGPPSVT